MQNDKDTMQIIHENMCAEASAQDRAELSAALFSLFEQFKEAYRGEIDRMRKNEKLYHAKHWEVINSKDSNAPKPVTPIIFSTIENLKADMLEETPKAVIRPENLKDDILAKMLSKIIEQDLDASDYAVEYEDLCLDLLLYGWNVQEVLFDQDAHQGRGLACIRRVAPMCFMSDPSCEDIQNGRACFKATQRTKEWFREHYPEQYSKITYRTDIADEYNRDANVRSKGDAQCQYLIEAWVKRYDAQTGKDSVHMAILGGDVLLELSCDAKPEGYYDHGQYPFVVAPLVKIAGSPLGLGVPDMSENAQLQTDKIDQIILKNSYMASHNKLLVTDASGFDAEDLSDWEKDVHRGESLSGVTWFSTPPLPSYMLSYLQLKRESIREESGANDQSRGQTTAGVTAASAISALQAAATKRSTQQSDALHSKFKKAVRMLLDVEREFGDEGREVIIVVQGEEQHRVMSKADFARLSETGEPIEYQVTIKTAKQSRYETVATNELALQLGNIYGQMIDPIDILHMMEFEGRDLAIERIIASRQSELVQLRTQNAQMQQAVEQLSQQVKQYSDAFAKVQGTNAAQQYRQMAKDEAEQAEQMQLAPEQSQALLQAVHQQ